VESHRNSSQSASLLSPRLLKYFSNYELYHKTRGNQVTHTLGIPLIVVSLLGLLGRCVIAEGWAGMGYLQLDGGTALLALGAFWYLYLDWKIAVPFLFFMTGLYFLGRSIPTSLNIFLFVLGWTLQGIGHFFYEKRSPAFAQNIFHLLTGPLWIFTRIVGYQ
jgi:uncharacterized membrane protein YGL010W